MVLKPVPPSAELDPAVRELALTTRPTKHSQRCPVWETKSPIETCNCWILTNARYDVKIVAPIIERRIRAEVAEGIAQAIEAARGGGFGWNWDYALDTAIAIARSYTPPDGTATPHNVTAQPEQGRD